MFFAVFFDGSNEIVVVDNHGGSIGIIFGDCISDVYGRFSELKGLLVAVLRAVETFLGFCVVTIGPSLFCFFDRDAAGADLLNCF